MRHKKLLISISVIAGILALSAFMFVLSPYSGWSTAGGQPVLEVVRLSPVGEPDLDFECKSFESVEFVFELHNPGSQEISGLSLKSSIRSLSFQTSS